tara:strand:+ start:1143 stop:1373 length:231 start_codon:yes stop_codon:yes gene_type:complete
MEIKTKIKQAYDLLDQFELGNKTAVRNEIRDCVTYGSPVRIVQVITMVGTIIREKGLLRNHEAKLQRDWESMIEML